MADTNSIFYKIGQATKSNVASAAGSAITTLKAANNTFTGTNDFQKTVTVGTDSTSANLTVKGNTTISGDLTVSGTTTTISSNNLEVKDNIIVLNDGAKGQGTTAPDAGLMFERKSGADNAAFLFEEANSRFEVGTTSADGAGNFGTVSLGALAVNSLLVGTRASTQALGDYADFNAGLNA